MVKIITDSVADIPTDICREPGISVVPLHVRFGDRHNRDVIDISTEEFSRVLSQEKTLPVTSVPSRSDSTEVYDALAKETDEILAERMNSIFPRERILRPRASPVIGTHAGPGLIAISILGDK